MLWNPSSQARFQRIALPDFWAPSLPAKKLDTAPTPNVLKRSGKDRNFYYMVSANLAVACANIFVLTSPNPGDEFSTNLQFHGYHPRANMEVDQIPPVRLSWGHHCWLSYCGI